MAASRVGCAEGRCVGRGVGAKDGAGLGLGVGCGVGAAEGRGVGRGVGAALGLAVGPGDGKDEGAADGRAVGDAEGAGVGLALGCGEGAADGTGVGAADGYGDGQALGKSVGAWLGDGVGADVGASLGDQVGLTDGAAVQRVLPTPLFQPAKLAGQLLHALWPVCSRYWPAGQLAHVPPVPAWPAGHAAHADLAWFTAHPAPDLQLVSWCDALGCHFACGHAAHTRSVVAVHAAVRFSPGPQEPQALQLAAPPFSWNLPAWHAVQSEPPVP